MLHIRYDMLLIYFFIQFIFEAQNELQARYLPDKHSLHVCPDKRLTLFRSRTYRRHKFAPKLANSRAKWNRSCIPG